MRLTGNPINLLSPEEIDCIHNGALRLLREMGMEIQNQSLLAVLADFGLPVDFERQRVIVPGPNRRAFSGRSRAF